MRVVKPVLTVALLAGLAVVWAQLDVVVSAYGNQGRSNADVRLGGLDLDVEVTPVGTSPYVIPTVPGSGSGPAGPPAVLAFDEGSPPPVASPSPPPSMTGGTARLGGTVTGPDGPVPGATVRVERHTADGVTARDLTTGPDGRWTLGRAIGGRYRVRAWLPPTLAMASSQVLFVDAGSEVDLDLTVAPLDPEPRAGIVSGGDIYVGLTGTVAVSITTESMAEDGLVVVAGVADATVTVTAGPEVELAPAAIGLTDADGVVRFTVRCLQAGVPSALIGYLDRITTVTLPTCLPMPPPLIEPVPSDDPDGPEGPTGLDGLSGWIRGPVLGLGSD